MTYTSRIAKSAGFDVKCDHHQLEIELEFSLASDMAAGFSRQHAANEYYQYFFDEANKKTIGFELQVQTKYKKMSELYSDKDKDQKVQVTCTNDACKGVTAWTVGKNINLCPAWFDKVKHPSTYTALEQCSKSSKETHKWDTLTQLRKLRSMPLLPFISFYQTLSNSTGFAVLHEMFHLDYATGDHKTRYQSLYTRLRQ